MTETRGALALSLRPLKAPALAVRGERQILGGSGIFSGSLDPPMPRGQVARGPWGRPAKSVATSDSSGTEPNERLLALIERWKGTPDEMGSQWWDELRADMAASRPSFGLDPAE